MVRIFITGTGVYTPEKKISNDELVTAFNAYADNFNTQNRDAIAREEIEPMAYSSSEFIEKASGIKSRFVLDKDGILDPSIMHPQLPERSNDELGLMAEMAIKAAKEAILAAGEDVGCIDAVICAASNHERAYPAIAIEVQKALGINGFGFDMNVACSSATFGIQMAADMIRSGSTKSILMVNPEVCSAHLEWRDRDCHFIFGDVCTAVLIQAGDEKTSGFEVLSTRCLTEFSNNIRNNSGFLRRTRQGHMEDRRDMLFMQEGRKVFKQVIPIVVEHIADHLENANIESEQLQRLWLHQANKSMNDLIGAKVLGRRPTTAEQPNILQDYANTSSAGSIIAFSKYSADLEDGAYGLICSFGAGYSVGSVVLRKQI